MLPRYDEDIGLWQLTTGSGTNNGTGLASIDQMGTGIITWQMDQYGLMRSIFGSFTPFSIICGGKLRANIIILEGDLWDWRGTIVQESAHSLLSRGIHLLRR